MKTWLAFVLGAATVLVVGVLAGFAFMQGGIYDVAASEDHGAFTRWVLETTKDRSVERRAEDLPGPLPSDTAALLHGLEHYRAMCEDCHAAPGMDRGEIGAGLNPRPPRLYRSAGGLSDEAVYWITKHGIRATGMPGFGATHGEVELLQIVAVVRLLTTLDEAGYADWVDRLRTSGIAGHHDASEEPTESGAAPHAHGPGAAPHEH